MLGFSNIDLYLNAIDYWGENAKLNPFTHTWSLGVEEQFYFVFPFIVWFTIMGQRNKGGSRHLWWLVSVTSLVSLFAYVYFSGIDQSATYFLMPFRFWEIGAGCLLFLLIKEKSDFVTTIIGKIPLILILFALIAALFIPLEFSAQATITVVFLTSLLLGRINTGHQARASGYALLSHPCIVFVGLISYSLYLWHWVVIVISRWTIGIHWWSIPLQLGLIALLAIGSYRYIEVPLRHKRWFSPRGRALAFLTSSTTIAGLFLCLIFIPNTNALYLGTVDAAAPSKVSEMKKMIVCEPTGLEKKAQNQAIRTLGDSHSNHIIPMLKVITDTCNMDLIHETQPNYIVIPSGDGRNFDRIDEVLASLDKGDLLILSSRNGYLYSIPYLNGVGDKWIDHTQQKLKKGFGLNTWLSELDSVIERAGRKEINVVLFMPNVEFDKQVQRYDAECREEWFRNTSEKCTPKVSKTFLDSRFPIQFYQEVKARVETKSNFYTFNPLPVYCPEENNECSRIVEGINVFKDTNHLTSEGAMLMLPEFVSFLNKSHLLN